jgi:hypothetical protein
MKTLYDTVATAMVTVTFALASVSAFVVAFAGTV